VLLLVSSATDQANAQTTQTNDAAREQARALAAQGYEALQRKDYGAAEAAFRRADALVRAPTIVVDHARALVGLGRLVEAHERYERVLREGLPANAPASWRRALEDAEEELAAIKPRLAWLTIRVSGPSRPVVHIDAKPIPRAALNVRRATDPGVRTVTVRASGYLPKEQTVTLKEGEAQELELELELDPSNNAELEEETEATSAPTPAMGEGPRVSRKSNTLAYVALSVGGASLAVGLATGFMTLRVKSDLDAECSTGVCRARDEAARARFQDDIDRYRLMGTISGVGLSVGVGASLVGGALLLFGANRDNHAELPAMPYVSAREFGLRGEF
jgi:hypothetical protein